MLRLLALMAWIVAHLANSRPCATSLISTLFGFYQPPLVRKDSGQRGRELLSVKFMFNPKNQLKMKIKLIRSYRSKNGNPTFVYGVTGSEADLTAFKEAQGEYYREDDNGTALWFTTRCVGDNGKLIITTNGNIVPDMSAFDQAASIASQYGGNFGQELAKQAAMAILNANGATAPVAAPATAEAPASTGGDGGMGEL